MSRVDLGQRRRVDQPLHPRQLHINRHRQRGQKFAALFLRQLGLYLEVLLHLLVRQPRHQLLLRPEQPYLLQRYSLLPGSPLALGLPPVLELPLALALELPPVLALELPPVLELELPPVLELELELPPELELVCKSALALELLLQLALLLQLVLPQLVLPLLVLPLLEALGRSGQTPCLMKASRLKVLCLRPGLSLNGEVCYSFLLHCVALNQLTGID